MSVTTEIDKVEIIGAFKMLQIRIKKTIQSGSESATNYERYVLTPADDVSAQPDQIKALTAILWTDDVKADYAAFVSQNIIQHNAEQTT